MSSVTTDAARTALRAEANAIWDARTISALLTWDQHTALPPGGASARAVQLAWAERATYDRYRSDTLARLIERLEDADRAEDPDDASLLRLMRHEHLKAMRVPLELREKLAAASGTAQHAWVQAREAGDYAAFLPHLRRNVELRRRYADCFQDLEDPYDAQLDDFDPGMRTSEMSALAESLKRRLIPLIRLASDREPLPSLEGPFPVERQRSVVTALLSRAGLDLDRARILESAHPMTVSMGIDDVGLTTRYSPESLDGIFLALHEIGHAHYEQGFDRSIERTPLAQGASAGVHEAQARLYENLVGRHPAFCGFMLELLREAFGEEFRRMAPEDFEAVVNGRRNSVVRLEADELTYPLHIVMRFELEREFLAGRLRLEDLPAAWAARVHEYLGLTVADDREGVLQDPHWAFGAFGYFPTYAVGNVIAVQLWNQIAAVTPAIEQELAAGVLDSVNHWLGEHIWRHGRRRPFKELLRAAVGAGLDTVPFAAHVEAKFSQAPMTTAGGS